MTSAGAPPDGPPGTRALVVRLDSAGDVLLSGPAVRAVAAGVAPDGEVMLLCGPQGAAAARLLPGVDRVAVWDCPWITRSGTEVTSALVGQLLAAVSAFAPDVAVILTSFHQSPLPLALLLRLAGVPRIVGASVDFAGTLLDQRLRPGENLPEDLPEPRRALAVARTAGFRLPQGASDHLAVRTPPDASALTGTGPYVVVHPGASAPARTWPAASAAAAVAALADLGVRVVVTGGPAETALTAAAAAGRAVDLGGRTDLATLSGVLADAAVVVATNTGAAHLAAAVGTPVASVYSPVVPWDRWAPYGVPVELLGDQWERCRGTRAVDCPVAGHPCLATIGAEQVVAACRRLAAVSGRPLLGRPAPSSAPRHRPPTDPLVPVASGGGS